MSRPDDPSRPDDTTPAGVPDATTAPAATTTTAPAADTADIADAAHTADTADTADTPAPRRRRRGKRRSWARRKHLGWITIGAAVLVLAAGLGFVVLTWDSGRTPPSAQAATVARTTPTTGDATTAPPPTAVGVPVATTVRGEVTAVGDSRYTMETRNGLTYTVLVTATTTFGRERAFDDFPVGAGLTVVGTLDGGVVTATTITPAPPN